MGDDFTAQAQRFVRSSHWDWRLESGVFGVLDVAVTLGFAFQGVASKLCFRDKSQLKWIELAILADGSVLRTCRSHSKRVVWCNLC